MNEPDSSRLNLSAAMDRELARRLPMKCWDDSVIAVEDSFDVCDDSLGDERLNLWIDALDRFYKVFGAKVIFLAYDDVSSTW